MQSSTCVLSSDFTYYNNNSDSILIHQKTVDYGNQVEAKIGIILGRRKKERL